MRRKNSLLMLGKQHNAKLGMKEGEEKYSRNLAIILGNKKG